MTTEKQKAVVYSRVSTLKQDNERQINDMQGYAVYKNLEIVKEFTETITGTTAAEERTEFKNLVDYITTNNIKHLLVSEVSRLGRVSHKTLSTINDLTEQGVCIHIEKEKIQTLDDEGKKTNGATLLLNIFAAVAEVELETLRYRVTSGLRRARLNHAGQSNPPFGFQNLNKKIALQPQEASIVKEIFSLYLSGKGSQQIARILNKREVSPRSAKLWSDQTVMMIIRNPIYNCQRHASKEIITIPEELRIIEANVFHAAQHIRKTKSNKHNTNRIYINILEGKLKCRCGESLWMHRRKDLRDNAYKCLSKRYSYKTGSPACSEVAINIDLLNSLVEHHLRTHRAKKYTSKKKTLEREADRLEKAIAKERRSRKRAAEMYIDELIDRGDFWEKKERIDKKIDTLSLQLEEMYEEIAKEKTLEFSRRYFGPDGKLKTPYSTSKDEFESSDIDTEALKHLVKQHVKEIQIQTLTGSERDKYKKNELDYVHEVTITDFADQATVYHTASRNKLIYKGDQLVTDKLETIHI